MKIDLTEISALKPSEYNPRALSKEEFKNLKNSLERFGFVDPIIANSAKGREGIVIGGHQRLHVAKELGMKQVPVHFISIPDIQKEKELNLRLNKNNGHWDWDSLANFEEEILLEAGFDQDQIDYHFELNETPEGGEQATQYVGTCPDCGTEVSMKKVKKNGKKGQEREV